MTTRPPEFIEYEALSKSQLAHDVLEFPISKLNAPTLMKTRLRFDLGIATVSQFIMAFKPGTPPRTGFGPKLLQPVCNEIAFLAKIGGSRYLKEVSLEHRTFLQLIHIIRAQLPPREGLIFDHRLFPMNSHSSTLEQLGSQLRLTRERIRQLEKRLILQFHKGNLREIGWLIRRNTLACFKPPVERLHFRLLLTNPFFDGVRINESPIPTPILFLGKVFPSTFMIDKQTIILCEGIQRRRNFT